MSKRIFTFILITLLSFAAFGQSKTAEAFEEEAEGYKVFLYQSMIRMLNKDKNPDFNMLIKDLDHLRFVMTDSVGDGARNTFSRLDEGVQGEGFEEIMIFDNKDYKCHVYELESRSKKSTWVATLFMEGRSGIIEMKGSLNLKYLNAFSSLNMDKLEEMLPMDGIGDWD